MRAERAWAALALLLALAAGGGCGVLKNADFAASGAEWTYDPGRVGFVTGTACASGACAQQTATGVFSNLLYQEAIIPPTLAGYQAIAELWANGISGVAAGKDCANDDARILLYAYSGAGAPLGSFTGTWASKGGEGKHDVNETWDLPANTEKLGFQVETGDCVQTTPNAKGLAFDSACLQTGVPWCSKTVAQWASSASASSSGSGHEASAATGEPREWDSADPDPSNCAPMDGKEWRPATRRGSDQLNLTYPTPVYLDRIVVVLDFEPGRVANITAFPADGSAPIKVWDEAWEEFPYKRADCEKTSQQRIWWSPSTSRTTKKVNKLRLWLKAVSASADEAYSSVDAVRIDGCSNANPSAPPKVWVCPPPPPNAASECAALKPDRTHDTTPTVAWTPGFDYDGDALTYHVSVGSTPYGSDVVKDATTTGSRYDVAKVLTFDKTYYVRVHATDPNGGTSTATDSSLKCGNDPPGTPYDVLPEVTDDLSPTLTWSCQNPDGDPIRYTINVGSEVFEWSKVPGADEPLVRNYLATGHGVRWARREVLFLWDKALSEIGANALVLDGYLLLDYLRDRQGLAWAHDASRSVTGDVLVLTSGSSTARLERSGSTITLKVTGRSDWTLDVGDGASRPAYEHVAFAKNAEGTVLSVSNSSSSVTFTMSGDNKKVTLSIPGRTAVELASTGSDRVVFDRTDVVKGDTTKERRYTVQGPLAYGRYHAELWAEDVFENGDVMPNGVSAYRALHTFEVGELPYVRITSHRHGDTVDGGYSSPLEVTGESNFPGEKVNVTVLNEHGKAVRLSPECVTRADTAGRFKVWGYLFRWSEATGADAQDVRDFLASTFGYDWAKDAALTKLDSDKTLRVSSGANAATFTRSEDAGGNPTAGLSIPDGTRELIAKREGGVLNVYNKCITGYMKSSDDVVCQDSLGAWTLRAYAPAGDPKATDDVLVRVRGASLLDYSPSVLECVSIDATACSLDLRLRNRGGLTSLSITKGASLKHWAELYPVAPPALDAGQTIDFTLILNPPGTQANHTSKLEVYVQGTSDEKRCHGGALVIPVVIQRIQLFEVLDYYVRLPALGRDVELVKRFAVMEVGEGEEELVSVEVTVW